MRSIFLFKEIKNIYIKQGEKTNEINSNARVLIAWCKITNLHGLTFNVVPFNYTLKDKTFPPPPCEMYFFYNNKV